jgi:hypothetical protein
MEKTENEPNIKNKKYNQRHLATIPLSSLVKREPFKSSFPLDEDAVLQKIQSNMENGGFDSTQPIIVWNIGGENVVLDGHRRSYCWEKTGAKEIEAFIYDEDAFDSDEDAIIYIKSLQYDRRNLGGDSDLFKRLLIEGTPENYTGKEKDAVASLYNISSTKAVRMLCVYKKGKKFHKKITNDKMSINEAYTILNPKKEKEKENDNDQNDDELTTNETNNDIDGSYPSESEENEFINNNNDNWIDPEEKDLSDAINEEDSYFNKKEGGVSGVSEKTITAFENYISEIGTALNVKAFKSLIKGLKKSGAINDEEMIIVDAMIK